MGVAVADLASPVAIDIVSVFIGPESDHWLCLSLNFCSDFEHFGQDLEVEVLVI